MDAFAKMPIWLFHYPIKPNSKIIYCYLLNLKNIRKTDLVQISVAEIAEANSVGRKAAGTSLQELEEHGLVKINRATPTSIPEIEIQDSFSLESKCLESKCLESKRLKPRVKMTQEHESKRLKPIHYIKNSKKNIKEHSSVQYTNQEIAQESEQDSASFSDGFERFWSAYPKKRSKTDAYQAWVQMGWDKANPDKQAALIQSVHDHARTRDWTKEKGRYIPFPAGYLRRGMWEDDVSESTGAFCSVTRPSYDTNLFRQKATEKIEYRKREPS